MTKAVNSSEKGVATLGKFRASVSLLEVYVGGGEYVPGGVAVFGGAVRALHTLPTSSEITQ